VASLKAQLARPAVYWTVAALWFLMLALAMTWPMAQAPIQTVVGHEEATAACHVWVLWWAQNHLGDPQTNLLFFPHGADVVTLYGSDVLSPLLFAFAPIPPTLAHNLWVLILVVLGGCGGTWLGHTLGAHRWGALAGGTVFATAPFFQHEILNGTTEVLAAAVLPWFAGVVWRLLARPSVRLGVALGLLTALGTWASAYNAFFLVLVGLCIFLHRLSTAPGRVLTPGVWRAGLAGIGVAMSLLSPLIWLQATHGAGATLARREDWRTQDPPLPDSFADLSDWFNPTPAVIPEVLSLPTGGTFSYWTTCSVFLGFVAVALGAWGVWRRRAERVPSTLGRVATPFLLMVVVGALIASGPVARLGGEIVSLGGVQLSMPATVLAELFPPFVLTALHAYRYTAVVVTGLAALVALGVRGWWWPLLIAAEALLLAPTPWPAEVTDVGASPVLLALAEEPPGAVLTLPTQKEDLHDFGRALLAQTVHGQPIHDGGIHRRAGQEATAAFDEVLLLNRQAQDPPRFPTGAQARFDLGLLFDAGFRWILVPAEETEALAWSGKVLGAPTSTDDAWALWEIPAAVSLPDPPTLEAPAPSAPR
jgi:hypothetical protein